MKWVADWGGVALVGMQCCQHAFLATSTCVSCKLGIESDYSGIRS